MFHEPRPLTASQSVAVGCIVCLVAVIGLMLLRKQAENAPWHHTLVGEFINFNRTVADPSSNAEAARRVNASVHAWHDDAEGKGCQMSPVIMLRNGGSISVAAYDYDMPGKEYRIHWIGPRTFIGTGDCGPVADLRIGQYELEVLAREAGGFSGTQPVFMMPDPTDQGISAIP